MKKLHLILLSLVAAVPGGYLCYLLGTALALPRSDLWKKPLLGGAVVGTGLMVLLAAVVWPLLYAVAFYDDPNKYKKSTDAEGDAAVDELEEDSPKSPRSESFEEEDVDVFEREGETADDEEATEDDEFESDSDGSEFDDSEGSEFDVEEDSVDQAETADFDLGDDEFADLEIEEEVEEEEEEAPKKKAKKKKK